MFVKHFFYGILNIGDNMKKGFTLIELLAVIIVLGIIALIAIPQVSNSLENARKDAVETSAKHYMDAVYDKLSMNKLDKDKTNNITTAEINVEDFEVNITGTKPTSGRIIVENNKIKSADLKLNGYTIICNSKRKCTAEKGEFKYFAKKVNYTKLSQTVSERPTNTNTYLKSLVEDNTMIDNFVCIYSDGEFCLKNESYDILKSKLYLFFDYANFTYKIDKYTMAKSESEDSIRCTTYNESVKCYDDNVSVSIAKTDNQLSYIQMKDKTNNLTCRLLFTSTPPMNCW